MNTATTKTEMADNSARALTTSGAVRKKVKRDDVAYKGDVVEVWTTSNHPGKKAGVKKILHVIHAKTLIEKGMVTDVAPVGDEESNEEGGSKKGRGKK
jgi:hypothetical protein